MPFSKLNRYRSLPLYDQFTLAELLWYRTKGALFYRRIFASFGAGSAIFPPMLLRRPALIHIGANVTIRPGVRLEAVVSDPARLPEIRIGDNVNIEQNVHIVAQGSIVIEENASIAANCAIICGSHPFWDVHDARKIGDRPGDLHSRTVIGRGSMLGVGTIIHSNVRLGQSVVTGAGTVVKKSVPDFSILEGNPAHSVMRYDQAQEQWIPTPRTKPAPAPMLH